MCKQRDCLGYTGKVDSPLYQRTEEMLMVKARSAANSRIANFLVSMQKFLDSVEEALDETCTDQFADHGDPYMTLDNIDGLVKSFQGYLKEFRKETK